jgi:hypothetical protein
VAGVCVGFDVPLPQAVAARVSAMAAMVHVTWAMRLHLATFAWLRRLPDASRSFTSIYLLLEVGLDVPRSLSVY